METQEAKGEVFEQDGQMWQVAEPSKPKLTGTPSEKVEKFDALHGGNAAIFDGAIFLFPDGAWRERNIQGCMSEPSDKPEELARFVLRYHRLVAERACKAFEDRKHHLAATARLMQKEKFGGTLPEEQIEGLNVLLVTAKAALAAYEKAQEEYGDDITTDAQKERAAHFNENKKVTAEQLDRISDLNL